MLAGQPRQSVDQRLIVFQRRGQLVVQALVLVRFDAAAAEGDAFGDQQTAAGGCVIVGEVAAWHPDRKVAAAGEQGEVHFRRHQRAEQVAQRVAEVPWKFGEQLCVQASLGAGIADAEGELATGAAAEELLACGDGLHAVVRIQHAAGAHGGG
ncbi:hypothetical protein D9M68_832010 [compost metagenome]